MAVAAGVAVGRADAAATVVAAAAVGASVAAAAAAAAELAAASYIFSLSLLSYLLQLAGPESSAVYTPRVEAAVGRLFG